MTNRFSTDILKRLGSRERTKQVGDKFINTFQESFGSDFGKEHSSVALSDKTLVGGQLSWDDYYSAKSFFNTKGVSETNAITMALLMIDVSKFSGISVMKLLEPIANDSQVMLDLELYAIINLYRPKSSKQNVLVRNNNKKSFRRRNILA